MSSSCKFYQLLTRMIMNDDQKGFSALPILIMLVLSIAILWEANEFAKLYSVSNLFPEVKPPVKNCRTGIPSDCDDSDEGASRNQQIICLSGDATDCNDSNDEFILTE